MGLVESSAEEEAEPRAQAERPVENIFIFDQVACRGHSSHRIRYNPETKYRVCVRCDLTDHPARGFAEKLQGAAPKPSAVKVVKVKGNTINISNRDAILARDGFKGCRYCGLIMRLTIEHLDSHHAGGSSSIDNLGLSCGQCNNLKGAMTEGEFLNWLVLGIVPSRIPVDAQLGLHRQEAKRRTAAAGFQELLGMLRDEGSALHSDLHSPKGFR